mmetsp:Transcript_40055/g.96712  ORF Transcript_40055/g.96712 Transcript_40055/m.96712 type:complete len:708 (+) Transcript_40055:301-2424(+)
MVQREHRQQHRSLSFSSPTYDNANENYEYNYNHGGSSSSSSSFRPLKRRRSLLPPAAKVVSEGFIEIVFLFLGIGVLLPWNAFISAKHYFTQRLCDEDTGRPVIESIEGYFSIIYNGASVLSLAVVILIQYLADDDDESTVGMEDSNTVTTNTTAITTRSTSPGLGCTPPPPAITTTPTTRRKLLKKSSSSTVSAILYSTKNVMSPMSTKSLRVDTSRGNANYTWYMVMLPLAVYLVVFCMTTILVFVPGIPPTVFAIFTLLGLFICGVCTAAATSGIVGTAGLFDSSIGVNPYFNGQAVGGLLVSMANLLARFGDGSADFFIEFCGSVMRRYGLNDDDDDDNVVEVSISMPETNHDDKCVHYSDISWATAGYFAMSCLILSACILGYSYIDEYKQVVRRNSFAVGSTANYSSINTKDELLEEATGNRNESGEGTFKPLLVRHLSMDAKSIDYASDGSDDDGRDGGGRDVSKTGKRAAVTFSSYQNDERNTTFGVNVDDFDRLSTNGSDTSENTQQTLTASIWHSVKGTAVCLFLVYFCTLGIFPVWTTELISAHQCQSSSRFQNDLFTPLSFVIFNVGDLAGRTMSSAIDLTKAQDLSSKLVWGSVLRMTFFVAFLFCQAQHNRFFKSVIQSDIWSWSLQFVFAWTNGFMTNIAFCYAPTLVENKTNPQQMASAILNFALSFGLLVGSFFAYPYLSFAGNHVHGHT